jgi:hypothetical protein
MKLGRHHEKRISALPRADVRHRTAGLQAREHTGEMPGSGGPHRQPDSVSRRQAGWLRRRCRWVAARLRTATGVTGSDVEREDRSDQRTPWLGLLLWALACVGLIVSLLMQVDELDDEPRLAAREAIEAQPATGAENMLDHVGKSRP